MHIDQFRETFIEEARELLGTLEEDLLRLETDPANPEILSSVFRTMHTIKGSASMFGFEAISEFAHGVEDILSALRDGDIPFSSAIVEHTLAARDLLSEMLDFPDDTALHIARAHSALSKFSKAAGFRAVVTNGTAPAPANVSGPPPVKSWRITFSPGIDAFRHGMSPSGILSEISGFGETVAIADCSSVPGLSAIDPESAYISWDVFVRTAADEGSLRDIFAFVADVERLEIVPVAESADGPESKKIGDILVERGKLDRGDLERVLGSRKKTGEALLDEKLVSASDVKSALEEQKFMRMARGEHSRDSDFSTVRVKSEKLDSLMALVGELVSAQARIRESATRHVDDADLVAASEQLGRLMDELRDNSMSVRMVPVGSIFGAFRRLVRDLSLELGKRVRLEIAGEETELDKSIVERLQDPLMHLVRNSLDHGLETPDERIGHGKPEEGTIRICAAHSGSFVTITVEDDGRGLDRESIRAKAIEKGLIPADRQPSEQELLSLIFLPGFSTKSSVTSVSGRGVGMDVVKSQMDAVGGVVEVSTEAGSFSRFSLRIPLTLAIIDGLLTRVSDEYYVVPLSCVDGCAAFTGEPAAGNATVVTYQERQLPCVDLRKFFGIGGDRSAHPQTVIVSVRDAKYGLVVDAILGNIQAVVKPLGAVYRDALGVSSATIRGDGSVALIVDPDKIIQGGK